MVELLGVLIVLGLIASLVVVNWAGLLPGTELNAAVHNLGAAIQGARSDAVARNGEFRLYYDLEQAAWWVLSPYRSDGLPAETEEQRLKVQSGFFPENVAITRVTVGGREYIEGTVYVTFDPLGRAVDHTVTIKHMTFNNTMTVEVLPLTGLVRFHDGEFQRPILMETDF
jgi:Tfp pilus assembly protein FimT